MDTLTANDITCCYWTLVGAPYGLPPRFTFGERIAAAARAGFAGVGMHSSDYTSCRERGLSDADIRRIVSDTRIRVSELETYTGWSSDDEETRAAARKVEDIFYVEADMFGPRYICVSSGEDAGKLPPLERVVERFLGVCERAASHGLRVAIEFMPYRGIGNAGVAWEIVQRSGQANAGVLVDAWHHYRGAADPALIRAIPADRIVSVQISDADAEVVGDLREDGRHNRRPPGSGSFDLTGFVRMLDDMGVAVPFGAEIISDEQAARPLDEAARVAYEGARGVLNAARAGARA